MCGCNNNQGINLLSSNTKNNNKRNQPKGVSVEIFAENNQDTTLTKEQKLAILRAKLKSLS